MITPRQLMQLLKSIPKDKRDIPILAVSGKGIQNIHNVILLSEVKHYNLPENLIRKDDKEFIQICLES